MQCLERGKHAIRLAFSGDVTNFKDVGEAFSHEALVDPDVFFYKGAWFMSVFGKGNTVIAVSKDGTPTIYSAISEDGISYAFEPSVRFAVEDAVVIDCAVVSHKGVFHMFVPNNGPAAREEPRRPGEQGGGSGESDGGTSEPGRGPGEPHGGPGPQPKGPPVPDGLGYHATSKDGLSFTRADDVKVEGRRRWLGNAFSDGKLMTFVGTGEPAVAPRPENGGERPWGMWMATSEDGAKWTLISSPAVAGADPGAVRVSDGGLVIVATGKPRPGTASAKQRKRPAEPGREEDDR